MEGLDFKGALKQLAERAGVTLTYERADTDKDEKDQLYKVLEEATLFFQKQLVPNAGPHAYLESRGVTQETMERFRIGYAPDAWRTLATFLKGKGYSEKVLLDAGLVKKSEQGVYDAFRSRIMFPLSDASGRVVGFSGRIFTTEGKAPDDIAKYLNTGETALFKKSKLLYGFDKAKQVIRKHDFSILVEGQMDLIMVHQAGWGNAVAKLFEKFVGETARVAFLSFSTLGSAEDESVSAVRHAVELVKKKAPGLEVDGEFQGDAALVAPIAEQKGVTNFSVAGRANVLIFPDLNAGNISYKLVQHLGGARAVGPILAGLAKPMSDLSRGCTDEDIVDAAVLTALF
jgi:DNA primase